MVEADRIRVGGLRVDRQFYEFLQHEVLPTSAVSPDGFWRGFEALLSDLMPVNRRLLAERARMQDALDVWHRAHKLASGNAGAYHRYLVEIGYLVPEPDRVTVTTTGVDREITALAGPQLVVPVTNARYALNAANARWGSLYDAFYGTDAIPGVASPGGYDRIRGQQVIARVRSLMDEFFPLRSGSHVDAVRYTVEQGALTVRLLSGEVTGLAVPSQFCGWRGDTARPDAVLLARHGLHWELQLDPSSAAAVDDEAGISDVLIEAALTTIVDFEDSVAVVDAADKVAAYRNWLGLSRGDLTATFEKDGRTVTRTLHEDRTYTASDGTPLILPGRSLLLVRNVGHHLMTDIVLDAEGEEVGEGILDAVVTTLCALPGLDVHNPKRNGTAGSIYIVKPKMHGPSEVAFSVRTFERVERLLGLAPDTLKLGLMDEERRTSSNLKAAIAEAARRIVFINTGFLDRSGDEIHTSMEAGPFVRKAALSRQEWMVAYENRNVDIGIEAGLPGHAQIGKGMWAAPDRMAEMLEKKIQQPLSGATTAWVPSPTAATLHALHYLRVDVQARQSKLGHARRTGVDQLLTIPLGDPTTLSDREIQEEVDNNVQSLLGYVVRWIDQGIGCSKVPDFHNVSLMEDRATLRISSQLLANWLRHEVVSANQVHAALTRMALIVDAQNAHDATYRPMSENLNENIAFGAAKDLIFKGAAQPNGYTERILYQFRREAKAQRVYSYQKPVIGSRSVA